MKTRLILFFLFFVTTLYGQNFRQEFDVKFYDGKSIEQLQSDSLVNDIVKSNDRLIYLNVKTPNGQQEFFRYDDTTYVFREKINEKIITEGNLQFEKIQPSIIDTIIRIDLDGIRNDTSVLIYCNFTKVGMWKEMNEKGKLGIGYFNKNKKDGGWYFQGQWIYYEADKVVGVSPPGKDSLVAHLDWLLDKKWICCAKHSINSDGILETSEWVFQINNKYNCPEFGTFTFQKNGTFMFEENREKVSKREKPKVEKEEEIESIPIFRYGGLGKWKVLENGNLHLEFSNKKIDELKFNYFGKKVIILESLSE